MKYILLIITFFLTSTTFALAPKPACPEASSLRGGTIDKYAHKGTHWDALFKYFKNDESWVVTLDLPDTRDEKQAKERAARALNSITFVNGPQEVFFPGIWGCEYSTSEGIAYAVEPCDESESDDDGVDCSFGVKGRKLH